MGHSIPGPRDGDPSQRAATSTLSHPGVPHLGISSVKKTGSSVSVSSSLWTLQMAFPCGVKKKTTGPKRRHSGQSTKLGLNGYFKGNFKHSQKCSLNWSVRNFLMSTSGIRYHAASLTSRRGGRLLGKTPWPSHLQRKLTLPWSILSFFLLIASLPLPPSYKTLFSVTPELPSAY